MNTKKVDLREINPSIPPCWAPYCLSNFPSRELISLLLQHLAEKRAYSSICLNWNIIGLGRGVKMPSTILKSFFLAPPHFSWLRAQGCAIWPFPRYVPTCPQMCGAINSISGLARLDLLPCIQDVPIGTVFPELGCVWKCICISFFVLKVILPAQLDGESLRPSALTRELKSRSLIRFTVTFFAAPSHCRNRMRCGH